MKIISPAFRDGERIPLQYTCKGQNISPPLNFTDVPKNARSLALIMHDPDAPLVDYVHWIVWEIPATTDSVAANSVPVGAVQGLNTYEENKYEGPCPPSGTHRYMFELYALDTNLGLSPATHREELLKAIQGHVLEKHTLMGTLSA